MLTIQSPQWSTQNKQDLTNKLSPCFRSKRIPSAHQNYSCSSNHNLKVFKAQSPSKFSEQIKRRKSQYLQRSVSKKKEHSTQDILLSIQYLKQQYSTLKDAYKQLINEKIDTASEINSLKALNKTLMQENSKLKNQNEELKQSKRILNSVNPASLEIEKIASPKENNILSISLTSMLAGESTKRKKQHLKVLSEINMNNSELQPRVKRIKREIGCKLQLGNKQDFNRFDIGSKLQSGSKLDLVQKIVEMQKKSKNKGSKPKRQEKQNIKTYKKKIKKNLTINQ